MSSYVREVTEPREEVWYRCTGCGVEESAIGDDASPFATCVLCCREDWCPTCCEKDGWSRVWCLACVAARTQLLAQLRAHVEAVGGRWTCDEWTPGEEWIALQRVDEEREDED